MSNPQYPTPPTGGIDPGTATVIANTATNVANTASTLFSNKKNRAHERYMYELQYRDNLNNWNRQNEYNSPAAQMARLKAAGLNPNLMYPQGNTGNSGNLDTPDMKFTGNEPARFQGGGYLSGVMLALDMDIKKQQANNLATDNAIKMEEVMLRRAQRVQIESVLPLDMDERKRRIDNLGLTNEAGRFDLDYKGELRSTNVDYRKAELNKLRAETAYTLSENERRTAMNSSNLQEAAVRILQMRAQTAQSYAQRQQIIQQIENLKTDRELKQLDLDFARIGVTKDMGLIERTLGQILSPSVGGFTKDMGEKLQEYQKKFAAWLK